MKKLSLTLLIMSVIFTALVLFAVAHDAKGKEVTVKGEVVDLQCYLVHPEDSRGPDHAKCAKACITRGLPVGLLADNGTLYLLLGPGHDSIKAQAAQYAGKNVAVTGTQVEQNGVKALQIKKIQ